MQSPGGSLPRAPARMFRHRRPLCLRLCARRSRISPPDSPAVSPLRTPFPSRTRRCKFARRYCRACSAHTHSLVRVSLASLRRANPPQSVDCYLSPTRTRRCLYHHRRSRSRTSRSLRRLHRQLRSLPRPIQCRRSRSLSRCPS